MIALPQWGVVKPKRLVVGVDPGEKGALCMIDALSERIELVVDMPQYLKTINGKQRSRTDIEVLHGLLKWFAEMEVELVCVEDVGAGFGASGRVLGENVGIIKALAHVVKLNVEWKTAARWKKAMICPSDKKEAAYRAEALFPHNRDVLRGARGGLKDGRAEAAMIALYAARYVLT